MIPVIPSGCTVQVIASVPSPADLAGIEVAEASTPEESRVFLEFTLAPGQDVTAIAAQIEQQCVTNGIPTWPEYATHVLTDGDTVYVMWVKGMAWMPIIGIVLVAVTVLGPILLLLVSPAIRDMFNTLLTLMIMVPMMLMMTKMFKPEGEQSPKEPLPPWEERVGDKIDRLTALVRKVEDLIPVSKSAAVTGIEQAAAAASSAASAVRSGSVTSSEKSQGVSKTAEAERKVAEYREKLPPELQGKLDELQRGVTDLKKEWAEKEIGYYHQVSDMQLEDAFNKVLAIPRGKSVYIQYAQTYALKGIELLHSTMIPDTHLQEYLRTQCAYVLSNLQGWRGTEAQEVKAVLRSYGH